jgi:hypothetical protein
MLEFQFANDLIQSTNGAVRLGLGYKRPVIGDVRGTRKIEDSFAWGK